MKESSFFTMELPPYFTFKAILSECARTYRRHPTTLNSNDRIKRNYTTETPHNYSDLNYAIVHNKDGDYAWRPFQMINPMIYTELAHMLTARGAWWELRKRFEKLQADPRIKCLSIPLRPSKSPTKTTILHWWREIEQASIHNALSWHYMATTDITDFYPSVYTHTIPWALHTKKVAKIIGVADCLETGLTHYSKTFKTGKLTVFHKETLFQIFLQSYSLPTRTIYSFVRSMKNRTFRQGSSTSKSLDIETIIESSLTQKKTQN